MKDCANIEITIEMLWERNIYGERKRSISQGDVKEIYNKTGTVLRYDSNEPIFRKKPERSKNNRKRIEREREGEEWKVKHSRNFVETWELDAWILFRVIWNDGGVASSTIISRTPFDRSLNIECLYMAQT